MIHHSRSAEVSRRAFLRASMLTAIAPAGVVKLGAADPPTAANSLIDAHVHVWTPDVKRYPLAKGVKPEGMEPQSFTPAELFAHCRPAGVGRIVLIQMIFYGTDNRYMLDAIAEHPDVFRGVAVIDETQTNVCQQMRQLVGKGVRGFRVYTDRKSAESWIDSAAMKAMWSCAAETGQAMCLLTDPDALPAIRRMCERFPKTRVVIDHFARIGMRGEVKRDDVENLCRLADFEATFVKTSAFYALGKKQAPYIDLGPLVRRVREAFGADRLMWASDCPYQVQAGHSYADSIGLIRDGLDFLSAEEKEWMLRKTAEQVFFS